MGKKTEWIDNVFALPRDRPNWDTDGIRGVVLSTRHNEDGRLLARLDYRAAHEAPRFLAGYEVTVRGQQIGFAADLQSAKALADRAVDGVSK